MAHLWAGRRIAGTLLLTAFGLLVIAAAVTAMVFRPDLVRLAVQPTWLSTFAAGILALGLVWVTVVIRSYQVVRPDGLSAGARTAGTVTVAVLCFAVLFLADGAAFVPAAARASQLSKGTRGEMSNRGLSSR